MEDIIRREIKYDEYELKNIDKAQAIAIACCDRNLKDSIYKEGMKNKIFYTLIKFKRFKIGLVKYKQSTFYWHIKVIFGEYGAVEKEKTKIPFIKNEILIDGEFDESNNIECIVSCENGEYFYKNEYSINDLYPTSEEEYYNCINEIY